MRIKRTVEARATDAVRWVARRHPEDPGPQAAGHRALTTERRSVMEIGSSGCVKLGRVPRRNRVDPWGDLHAVEPRGLLTGNRGCVVDDHENVVRHHGSSLWIVCLTRFRDWKFPLARPRRWTPLFFLDDTVALAAGHRPCATCRRAAHVAYRDAVTRAIAAPAPILAAQLNDRLRGECHRPGRGLARAGDRITWSAPYAELPDGTIVVAADGGCRLVVADRLLRFSFAGWEAATPRPTTGDAKVLTPPTSVAALAHGYQPVLHPSARAG